MAVKSQVLASLQESYEVRLVRTNTFQTWVKYNWRHCRTWRIIDIEPLLESPAADVHTVSLPEDRVIVVNTKEHLPLDARRLGNRVVKALVNPLDNEKRLRRETFENTLEDFGGVENLVARLTACRVVLGFGPDHSLGILLGALANL